MNVTPYWNKDKTMYAVLVSHGYGSGFSTWSDDCPEIACDNRVIEWFLAHDDDYFEKLGSFHSNKETEETHEFFKSLGYNGHVCMLGFKKCDIEWVPSGVIWRMDEYDGAEHIEYQNDSRWICFN